MAAHLLRKFSGQLPIWLVRLLGGLWFPYLGAGIRITEGSKDYRYIRVCLKRSWYNVNYVGTQFGGSMYSMTDPFYLLMLIQNLGPDYIVWDKAASIDFKTPGKTELHAEFRIDDALLDRIRAQTESGEKYIFDLPVEVFDTNKNLVASVIKTMYVRKKRRETPSA